MKWQIVVEVKLDGEPDAVDGALDGVMEGLIASDIEDPSVGAALASGVTEVEFVVDAPTVGQAQRQAQEIFAKVLGMPGEIIGESARRTLVPA